MLATHQFEVECETQSPIYWEMISWPDEESQVGKHRLTSRGHWDYLINLIISYILIFLHDHFFCKYCWGHDCLYDRFRRFRVLNEKLNWFCPQQNLHRNDYGETFQTETNQMNNVFVFFIAFWYFPMLTWCQSIWASGGGGGGVLLRGGGDIVYHTKSCKQRPARSNVQKRKKGTRS